MLVGVMVDSVYHAVEVFELWQEVVGEPCSTEGRLLCDVCRDRPAVTTRHGLVVFVCGACVGIEVERCAIAWGSSIRSESGFSPVLIAGRNRVCGIDRTQVVRA
jgi:hypothetical protein